MDFEQVCTLVILVGTLVLLVGEWVPAGITGLLAIAALAVTGVLESGEAFAGMTDRAVLTVACMYVISAGVAGTGLAAAAANRVAATGLSPRATYVGLLVLTMLLSGFVNNTPLVLIMLPLVLGLASRMGESPSLMLIPLSFVSILGGMNTLIGTSTNLIVASKAASAEGVEPLQIGLFDFAQLGSILAVAGFATVMLLRRRVLPERASLGLLTQKGVAVEYMTEMQVRADGPFAGKSLAAIADEKLLATELRILEVVRGAVIRVPRPELELRDGDIVLIKGGPEAVAALRLREEKRTQSKTETVRGVELTLFEVVVIPGSPWVGRQVSDLALRDQFGASVFALQRDGAHLRDKIDRQQLEVGDVLLLQGSEKALQAMRARRGVLVVEGVDTIVKNTDRAPLASVGLLVFVGVAVTGILPVEVGALLGALLMILTRCLSVPRAYESVGWDVLFLVGGTIALGTAFEQTGLARICAEAVVELAQPFGARAVLGCLMVMATLLTQVLSNNATAAFMTPLALRIAPLIEGATPLACVMAVAFGANCSFLTPVSYNTNLLVYGPGGYRFRDYLRLGVPLTVVYLGLAIVLLPVIYS